MVKSNNEVQLTDLVDVQILQKIQDDFAAATDVSVTIRDLEANAITTPSNVQRLCWEVIRGTEEGEARCRKCDIEHEQEAAQAKEPKVYTCHAGLIDFAVPIEVNGKLLAYMFGGQVLPEKPDLEAWRPRAEELGKELGFDPKEYLNALKEIPILSMERVEAVARSMHTVVNYISDMASQRIRAERRVDEMAISLHEVGVAITSALDPRLVVQSIVGSAKKITGADIATVYFYDQAKDEFYLPVIFDEEFPQHPIPRKNGVVSKVLKRRKPVFAEDAAKEPILLGGTFIRERKIKSCVGIPLKVGEEPVGILFLNYLAPRHFTDNDKTVITAFAEQAAIAMQNALEMEKLRKRAQELTELYEIGLPLVSLTSAHKLSQTLEGIVIDAKDKLGADVITLYQYDQDRAEFVTPPTIAGEIREPLHMQAKIYKDDVAARIVQKRQPYFASDAKNDPFILGPRPRPGWPPRFIKREGIKSSAGIPLMVGEETVGLMFVNYRTPHHFTEDEKRLIRIFAHQAAIAIQNARWFERASERRVKELEALAAIEEVISSTLDLDKVLDLILEEALELTETAGGRGLVWLVDEATGELVIRASRGLPEDKKKVRLKIGEQGIIGWVAKEKTHALVQDVTQKPWSDLYVPLIPDMRSELTIPLLIRDKLIGVLDLESPKVDGFDEDDVRLLKALAGHAVIAIQNVEQHEKLIDAKKWEALGMAAGNLAHRMNSMVGIIPVCVQELSTLVREDPLIREDLEIIDRRAKHILELADRLLKHVRPSVTGLFDINLLLREALSVVATPLRIEVITKYSDDPPKVWASKLLVDVFVELTTNAMKAMPKEGRLEIGSRSAEKGWVKAWFTDTGCGIPPDKQGRVFDMFYTIGGEGYEEGLGLGLWQAKTILQQQGADIVLAWSGVGKGSTFVVKLPVGEGDE